MSKSPITCHGHGAYLLNTVLDASQGKPAAGVEVRLELVSLSGESTESSAKVLSSGATNSDGRCSDLLSSETKLQAGVYKMVFVTGPYFKATETKTFYPFVEITFNYEDPSQHYHIPLLLSPFSYTTYRGS
ncbi:hydroxyisourate hydrolase [Cryptococcus wingfieldii CBS 7118]|uniref:5-hydroxyisourate hydrolase n=1 Tax=Cryptococcus wingfieldii CBS 7118 TaxID=1295528 RepID=A0A1E3ISC7_9TREE|nr:hydroxyisourate hydrolase [Cryptococcus wingfieldii CBS 7118]ODN91472.1 hydroxyisourate hydrolase [Cryptococcus wingfieldii CBS 7118]